MCGKHFPAQTRCFSFFQNVHAGSGTQPALHSAGSRGSIPSGKAAKVKNEWSYTSTYPTSSTQCKNRGKRGAPLAYHSSYSTQHTYRGIGIRFLQELEVFLFSTEPRSNPQPFEWVPGGISEGIK